MKILISPTKTMVNKGANKNLSVPSYIEEAKELVKKIKTFNIDQIKSHMKINDKIANDVIDMYKHIKFDSFGTKAIESFNGLQYKNFDYNSLDNESKKYIQDNVYIYTALYGFVKPNDSIYRHRLDFTMKFNLYDFWGDKLYKQISDVDEPIIDIASKEFNKTVERYFDKNYFIIDFKQNTKGNYRGMSTHCKIERGQFLRWLAENKINDLEKIYDYDLNGYRYNDKLSKKFNIVFTRG